MKTINLESPIEVMFKVKDKTLLAEEVDSIVELCRRQCIVILSKKIDQKSIELVESRMLRLIDTEGETVLTRIPRELS